MSPRKEEVFMRYPRPQAMKIRSYLQRFWVFGFVSLVLVLTSISLAWAAGFPTSNPQPQQTKPPSGEFTLSLTPAQQDEGWVISSDSRSNQLGADSLWTGITSLGAIQHGLIQFDLSTLPPGIVIEKATLDLLGRSMSYSSNTPQSWRLRLLDSSVDTNWRTITYATVHNAAVAATIPPILHSSDLGDWVINQFVFQSDQFSLLTDRAATTHRISFRMDGPTASSGDLFRWDAGYGDNSLGHPPMLTITYRMEAPTATQGASTVTATATRPVATPTPCSGTTLLGCLGNNGIIRGYVWNDLNGDSQRQSIEPFVAGATVSLYNSSNILIASKVTGNDGGYEFNGLSQSSYTVKLTPPPGFPNITTAATRSIDPSDFVFCCTVVLRFGVMGGPVPSVTVFGESPTPTPARSPTPIPTVVLPFEHRTRSQLPFIQTGGDFSIGITVQNLGRNAGKAILLTWLPDVNCPPQSAGPAHAFCSGLLKPGSSWTWSNSQLLGGGLPNGTYSGIVYSLDADKADQACDEAKGPLGYTGWLDWEHKWAGFGPDMAVTVQRWGTDPGGSGRQVSSSYEGISESQEGNLDTVFGGYSYFVPLLYNGVNNQYSRIWIHNSGNECSSIEIYYYLQNDCSNPVIGPSVIVAPGVSKLISPADFQLPPGSVGWAQIRASQPLGIVVDTYGNGTLLSYRGLPADTAQGLVTLGGMVNQGPLIYREFNGWDTLVTVQNLSKRSKARVKVYFLDNNNSIITTQVDWLCEGGPHTFILPFSDVQSGLYVGSVRIESQDYWSPGDPPVEAPNILSIITVRNPQTGQGFSYNALVDVPPANSNTIMVPSVQRQWRDATVAGRTWSTELAIKNLNSNPGITFFRIDFYDQNGYLTSLCRLLNQGQVIYEKLDDIASIGRGFSGSAVLQVTSSTQSGGGALGVVTVQHGTGTGDVLMGSQGFPISPQQYPSPPALLCPPS
ncbi:MAG: hypothetical protein EXR62_15295 [Chloroflexi bacterium]|nr:hypothetical protein [Chloroflexota bacterium]